MNHQENIAVYVAPSVMDLDLSGAMGCACCCGMLAGSGSGNGACLEETAGLP
jgi:hypothetical protein